MRESGYSKKGARLPDPERRNHSRHALSRGESWCAREILQPGVFPHETASSEIPSSMNSIAPCQKGNGPVMPGPHDRELKP
jgi:hypothetical protein